MKKSICEKVEDILINEYIGGISAEDKKISEEHTRSCEVCARFEKGLSNMRASIEICNEPGVALGPEMLKKIHTAMESRKRSSHRRPGFNWQIVRNILGYRLPLYQPLAIILLLFAFNLIFTLSEKKPGNFEDIEMLENLLSEKSRVVDNMFFISEQKIGSNVREDSLITKYIVPTM